MSPNASECLRMSQRRVLLRGRGKRTQAAAAALASKSRPGRRLKNSACESASDTQPLGQINEATFAAEAAADDRRAAQRGARGGRSENEAKRGQVRLSG